MTDELNSITEEMNAIMNMLKYSEALQVECVWSALQHIKANPKTSIIDACDFAVEEWLK